MLKNSGEICVICLGIRKNPLLLKCGHSFCTDCINAYISQCRKEKKEPKARCPLCREKILSPRKFWSTWPRKRYIVLGFILTAAFIFFMDKGKSNFHLTI